MFMTEMLLEQQKRKTWKVSHYSILEGIFSYNVGNPLV